MKEYKTVFLNDRIRWSKASDLSDVDKKINETINDGWELFQVVPCAGSITGALIGVFMRDKPAEEPKA